MKTFYYNRNETNEGDGTKEKPFKYVSSLIKAVNADKDNTEFICYALNSVKSDDGSTCFFYHNSNLEPVDFTVNLGKTLTLSVDSSVNFNTRYLWFSNRTSSSSAAQIEFANIIFDASNKCESCYTDYDWDKTHIRPVQFKNCTFTNSYSYALTTCGDGRNTSSPLRYFYDCTINKCGKCVYCRAYYINEDDPRLNRSNRFWFYRCKFMNCGGSSPLFDNESMGCSHYDYDDSRAVQLFDTCLFYNLKGTSNIFYNHSYNAGGSTIFSFTHCTMCNITVNNNSDSSIFACEYYWSATSWINVANSIILWNNNVAKLVRAYFIGWTGPDGQSCFVQFTYSILTNFTTPGCSVIGRTHNITGYGNSDLTFVNIDTGYPYYFNKEVSSLIGDELFLDTQDRETYDNTPVAYLEPYKEDGKYYYINKVGSDFVERPATGFYKGASVMPKSWSISNVKAVSKNTKTDILETTDKSIWSNDTLTISAVFTQDSPGTGLLSNTGKANCIITLTDIAGKSFTLNSNVEVTSGNSVSFGEINISKLKEFGTLQKYNIQISFELTPDY